MGVIMCVLAVGGMDRLERDYINAAHQEGVKLKVYTKRVTQFFSKIGEADGVVIFTNKVSHEAKNRAVAYSKKFNKPVVMCGACGVCSLKKALSDLKHLCK